MPFSVGSTKLHWEQRKPQSCWTGMKMGEKLKKNYTFDTYLHTRRQKHTFSVNDQVIYVQRNALENFTNWSKQKWKSSPQSEHRRRAVKKKTKASVLLKPRHQNNSNLQLLAPHVWWTKNGVVAFRQIPHKADNPWHLQGTRINIPKMKHFYNKKNAVRKKKKKKKHPGMDMGMIFHGVFGFACPTWTNNHFCEW